MKYEKLLSEADEAGAVVKEMPLQSGDGRTKRNRIAIRDGMTNAKKACTLAEELGHYYYTVGDILDISVMENLKQEQTARAYSYNRMIGMFGIIQAYKAGCRNSTEIAEYLEITEEFLMEAIQFYNHKYGLYKEIDNYVIFFDPLGVLELTDQVERNGENDDLISSFG